MIKLDSRLVKVCMYQREESKWNHAEKETRIADSVYLQQPNQLLDGQKTNTRQSDRIIDETSAIGNRKFTLNGENPNN